MIMEKPTGEPITCADFVRAKTAVVLSRSLAKVMHDTVRAHGPDTNTIGMLVFAVDLLVREITKQVHPAFREALIRRLTQP